MHFKELMLILLLTVSVSAQEKVLDLIHKAQEQVKKMNPTPCEYCQKDLSTGTSCAQAICGVPTAQTNIDVARIEAVQRAFKIKPNSNEVITTVNHYLNRLKAIEKLEVETLRATLERAKNSEYLPSNEDLAIFNIIFQAQHMGKIKSKRIIRNKKVAEMKILEDETRRNLEGLSREDQNFIIETQKIIYKDFLANERKGLEIQTAPPAVFLKHFYPGLSVADAARAAVSEAQENWSHVTRMPRNVFKRFVAEYATLGEAMSEVGRGKGTESHIRSIAQFNKSFKIVSNYYSRNPKNPFLKRPVPSLGTIMASTPVDKLLEELQSKNTQEIETCYSDYLINRELLPNRAQIQQTLKDIELAKNRVKNNYLSKLSEKTRWHLEPVISNLEFSLPPTSEELDQAFLSTLMSVVTQREYPLPAKTTEDASVDAVLTLLQSQTRKTDGVSGPDSRWCAAFKYQALADYNATAFGAISISYTLTTASPDIRVGIIGHEIGHSIFHELYSKKTGVSEKSFQSFQNHLQCLRDQHAEKTPPERMSLAEDMEIKPEDWYSNEDFADDVGTLTGETNGTNPFCILQRINKESSLVDSSFVNEDIEDMHSSKLYRLLRTQTKRGASWPKACTQKGDTPDFKVCTAQHLAQ